jgi:hypothetical protein
VKVVEVQVKVRVSALLEEIQDMALRLLLVIKAAFRILAQVVVVV